MVGDHAAQRQRFAASTTTREVLDREWEAEPDEEPVVG